MKTYTYEVGDSSGMKDRKTGVSEDEVLAAMPNQEDIRKGSWGEIFLDGVIIWEFAAGPDKYKSIVHTVGKRP